MTAEQFTAPAAVVDALMAAHHALGTAQTAANGWDRAGLGREIDRIRWALGDLIAQVQPPTDGHTLNRETGVWELGDAHPFTNATERDDAWNTDNGCTHDWEYLPTDTDTMICVHCGRFQK